MARGQGQKKGVDHKKPTCKCSAVRPNSNPSVHCSCHNNPPEGETLCVSCSRGRHVY